MRTKKPLPKLQKVSLIKVHRDLAKAWKIANELERKIEERLKKYVDAPK